MGGAGFIIPNVRAIAEAAAEMIVNPFEPMEFAIGGTEGSGGAERGEISHGGFENDGRQSGFTNGFDEQFGLRFEVWEVLRRVFGSAPGARELSGIPVTDDGILFTFGSFPTTAGGRAIGKMPGEEEFVIGSGVRGDGALKTERAD